MSTIFGQPSALVNLADRKPLDNFVQWAPGFDPCTTPDKPDEPGLPISIFRHGVYRKTHTVEDPRYLWIQRYNGSAQNRRAGLHAELPEEREPLPAVELWEPRPEPKPAPLPTVAEVFAYFAPIVGARCCIAGGAIRDELIGRTPKDFDVFCFGEFDHGPILAETELLKMERVEYGGHTLSLCLTVKWRGAQLQFVQRGDCHDVDSLLDSFDWGICLFAYDAGGIVKRMDPANIGRDLLRLNPQGGAKRTAVKSLRRGFMFAERYGMQINDEDLAALCAEIVSGYADTHAEYTTEELVKG